MELDFLTELLKEEAPQEERYPRPVQVGPLRYVDKEMRCASRGCGSSTHYKLKGIPYCPIGHLIPKMNEMLYELGVES